jgi:HAD superfamily hydrolase (TIGR01490 family)
MPVAFFDLDRTLLSVNSGSLWVRFEQREGRLSALTALRAAFWLGAYHLGFSRIEPLLLEAIASLAGEEEAVLRQRTTRFFDAEVRHTVRPGARLALARHRAAGDTIALLSSTSMFLADDVRALLDIHHIGCNRFSIHEGRLTGLPDGPLCFGAGKLHHARLIANTLSEHLQDATFYTDSASDVPAMEEIGHPVAVNPDPTLARIARQRGWPVEDWGV